MEKLTLISNENDKYNKSRHITINDLIANVLQYSIVVDHHVYIDVTHICLYITTKGSSSG
jgi:hypothetical protein